MESLRQRQAKINTVPAPQLPRVDSLSAPPASAEEGVIVSRPCVSAVQLPSLVPDMLHDQACSASPGIVTLAEPAVHVYAGRMPRPRPSRR